METRLETRNAEVLDPYAQGMRDVHSIRYFCRSMTLVDIELQHHRTILRCRFSRTQKQNQTIQSQSLSGLSLIARHDPLVFSRMPSQKPRYCIWWGGECNATPPHVGGAVGVAENLTIANLQDFKTSVL